MQCKSASVAQNNALCYFCLVPDRSKVAIPLYGIRTANEGVVNRKVKMSCAVLSLLVLSNIFSPQVKANEGFVQRTEDQLLETRTEGKRKNHNTLGLDQFQPPQTDYHGRDDVLLNEYNTFLNA